VTATSSSLNASSGTPISCRSGRDPRTSARWTAPTPTRPFPYVTRRLNGVEHDLLSDAATTVRGHFEGLQSALETLAIEDDDAQYHATRLADLLFDVASATLLLAEGQSEIEAGDARKALVARRFVATRPEDDEAYGVTAGTALGDECFDVLARYGRIAPEALVTALEA
jgi:acyl-CoA dehydrogenase